MPEFEEIEGVGGYVMVHKTVLEGLRRKVVQRRHERLTESLEVACLAAVALGVYLLVGRGWTCIVAGLEGLLFVTVEAWLPLVISRHGRRHGTDTRTRERPQHSAGTEGR